MNPIAKFNLKIKPTEFNLQFNHLVANCAFQIILEQKFIWCGCVCHRQQTSLHVSFWTNILSQALNMTSFHTKSSTNEVFSIGSYLSNVVFELKFKSWNKNTLFYLLTSPHWMMWFRRSILIGCAICNLICVNFI